MGLRTLLHLSQKAFQQPIEDFSDTLLAFITQTMGIARREVISEWVRATRGDLQ